MILVVYLDRGICHPGVRVALLFFSPDQFLGGTCLKLPNRGVVLEKKVVHLYRSTRHRWTRGEAEGSKKFLSS